MHFQNIIAKLNEYWSNQGCVILQGYDLEVLRGGAKTLSAQSISIIGVECYFARNYKGQSYFWNIADFLESKNYHFHSFTRLVRTKGGNIYFGDATFISDTTWKKLGLL